MSEQDPIENQPPAESITPPQAESIPVNVEPETTEEQGRQLLPSDPPAPNVYMAKPVFVPKAAGAVVESWNSLALIGSDIESINASADQYRNMDQGRSHKLHRWVGAVSGGQNHMLNNNAFATALRNPNSDWRQSVLCEGEELKGGVPKFGENSNDGGRLTGANAMMKVRGLLKMGTLSRIPLWSSGLWVGFRAPAELDFLELQRRVAQEKISLGRMTNGMVFSNTSVYLTSYLVNFALEHVYEATYRQASPAELKDLILTNDYPQLLWGLLCAIYPSGYLYRMPCMNDPSRCNHVVEDLVEINKMSFPNNRVFTHDQRKHMQNRTGKFTDDELQRYRKEHRYTERYGTVDLTKELRIVLKVPSLSESERSGFAWVDGIVERTERAFSNTLIGEERNRYISEQGVATGLRQYAAWIDKLILLDSDGNAENVIDQIEDIEDTIAVLTASEDVYEAFFKAVGTFIENTTISVIGVPRINCPNCQQPMAPEHQQHPHLVAVDVPSVFFTLVDQRIQRLLQ